MTRLDEAIALAPNGRLWRYDISTDTTRLIAEGFHFINGVLYDLHPGAAARGVRAGHADVALSSHALLSQWPESRTR
jgi:hypothetical protein